jgi:hypothetical protein
MARRKPDPLFSKAGVEELDLRKKPKFYQRLQSEQSIEALDEPFSIKYVEVMHQLRQWFSYAKTRSDFSGAGSLATTIMKVALTATRMVQDLADMKHETFQEFCASQLQVPVIKSPRSEYSVNEKKLFAKLTLATNTDVFIEAQSKLRINDRSTEVVLNLIEFTRLQISRSHPFDEFFEYEVNERDALLRELPPFRQDPRAWWRVSKQILHAKFGEDLGLVPELRALVKGAAKLPRWKLNKKINRCLERKFLSLAGKAKEASL